MNVAWLRWFLGLMFCYDRGLVALEQQLPRRVRGVRNQPSVVVMFWGKEATKSDDHCIFMHFFPNSPLQGVVFCSLLWAKRNALGTFDSTERWGFQRQFPTRSVSPISTPWLKSFQPKWAKVGFETVAEPRKLQAVAVVVVPRLQLQILGLRCKTFKFRQWHGIFNMLQVFILTLFQFFLWKSTPKGKKIPWILSAFKGPRWRSINLRRCRRSWPWAPLHPNWQADHMMVGKLIKIVKNLGGIAKALVTFWYVLGNVYKKLWLVTLMI